MAAEINIVEKIKQAIRNIFKENNGEPLDLKELVLLVNKQLSDGEINTELVLMTVDIMCERFELIKKPGDKICPNK